MFKQYPEILFLLCSQFLTAESADSPCSCSDTSSLKVVFVISTGKERLESSFLTESKKNLIFLFVVFR